FHIYGTTEIMCPLYNPDPVGEHIRLRPGFYCQTRIITIGGTLDDVVDHGEEGELIVEMSPDQMFTGYLNQPDATSETVVDGWYHTGDVCLLREDGDYNLIGRTGDIIRSGGENIHPSEIEPHLSSHPNIKESSVIGIKDVIWGEMVVACIVTNGSIDALTLKEHMKKSSLANFKHPKAYLYLDNLPRNAANKILRRELCQIAEEERKSVGKNYIEV
ncbi:MAG: long-chain fatty acid--CoA ligase, partial [Pseudomonadota bacterium]|nr:long-chain fatty acid--CoA ligase [Pseudomonadota bacterium]